MGFDQFLFTKTDEAWFSRSENLENKINFCKATNEIFFIKEITKNLFISFSNSKLKIYYTKILGHLVFLMPKYILAKKTWN